MRDEGLLHADGRFVLSHDKIRRDSVQVYVDGLLQRDTDYYVDAFKGEVVVLDAVPASSISVLYETVPEPIAGFPDDSHDCEICAYEQSKSNLGDELERML